MILSQKNSVAGNSLIEATIAACTSALFLGSLFTMNMVGMKTIRTARATSSASQILQQRVESLRIANWHQVTDADWLQKKLMDVDASGGTGLNQMTETLTLIPYGSESTTTTTLVRSAGSTQIVNRNNALLGENAMKVVWTVAYNGGINNNKPMTSQTVAILAKGGVAKW
jgi:hypothetical protein